MNNRAEKVVRDILRKELEHLTEHEKRVVDSFIKRARVSRNINEDFEEKRSFGEKVADKVAAFGGSWTFIFLFIGILLLWVILNSFILAKRGESFDPYPYILLNLFLSMLAAIQAPIILMSQNRQAARDRMDAAHDYEVNLKAELEIRHLHEKLDELREQKWTELVEMQKKQILALEEILSHQPAK